MTSCATLNPYFEADFLAYASGMPSDLVGVVSLLDMLEFAARDYVDISYRFGLLLGMSKRPDENLNVLGDSLNVLVKESSRLGLVATQAHLGELLIDFAKQSPESIEFNQGGFVIKNAQMDYSKLAQRIEAIHLTLKAELGAILFKTIARDKAKYCNPKWLENTEIFRKYPETVDEFQAAGR